MDPEELRRHLGFRILTSEEIAELLESPWWRAQIEKMMRQAAAWCN